jgi:hypothetical protein
LQLKTEKLDHSTTACYVIRNTIYNNQSRSFSSKIADISSKHTIITITMPWSWCCSGADLRAAMGCAEAGFRTACIINSSSRCLPWRPKAESTALGETCQDDWRWHMYDTVKVPIG